MQTVPVTSMKANNKSYPLIPEEERKCVWMTTGFISYKLCERNYQCEFCPFDQAIKNEESGEGDFQESESDWTEGSLKTDLSARIGGSCFYHPDHCWAKVENAEKVRIGIDDLLTQLITNIQVVILPQVGSFVGQGECCAHIIQEDYILPVVSPLSGSIQTINPRLKKKPELITDDPRGCGWLLTVRPENLESDLKNLLFGRKAILWYQREEKEILARTDLIFKQSPQAVGPTMQDGGVRISRLRDLLNVVTSKQRAQILDFSITRRKNSQRSVSNLPNKHPSSGE
jgi:glycine cleavage system H protein